MMYLLPIGKNRKLLFTSVLFFYFLFSQPVALLLFGQEALQTEELVGHWSFDGNAEDMSGNGNHGIMKGAVLVADRLGNPSSACHFDGISSYVRIPNNTALNFGTEDFTISGWVRYQTPDKDGYPLSKGSSGMPGYGVRVGNKGHLSLALQADGGSNQHALHSLSAGDWHFFTYVLDRDGFVCGYLDGELIDEVPYSSGNTFSVSNARDLIFGSYNGTMHFFSGDIDEVRLYHKALSKLEVSNLYSRSEKTVRVVLGSPSELRSSKEISGATYQWQYRKDKRSVWEDKGVEISGPVFKLEVTSSSDGGYYRCLIKDTETGKFVYETIYDFKVLLEEGLVGHWPFDGDAKDKSGNGNHGIVNGTSLDTDRFGRANSAYRFDGIDDFIEVKDDSGLNFGEGDFSLCAWVKCEEKTTDWQAILNKGASGMPGYGLEVTKDKHALSASIQGTDGSNQHVLSELPVNQGNWQHLVGVFDRSGKVKLFIDGQLVKEKDYLSGNTNTVNNVLNLYFGCYNNKHKWFFKGLLDDVRIYSKVLTDSEVRDLYVPVMEEGLVGYWSFNGSMKDKSGNGNHGVQQNISLVPDRLGNMFSACHFDGVKSHIRIPNSSTLNFGTGDFSICGWVRYKFTEKDGYVLSKGSSAITGYGVRVGDKGHLSVAIQADGGSNQHALHSFSPDEWHFFTYVLDRDGLIRGYLDGKLIDEVPYSSGNTYSVSNTWDFTFGSFNGIKHFFLGDMDEIRLYNRLLTESEMLSLYNCSKKAAVFVLGSYVELHSNKEVHGAVYQWQYRKDKNSEWKNRGGETTSPIFKLGVVSFSDQGFYRCLIKDTKDDRFFYETIYDVKVFLEENLMSYWAVQD